MCFVEMNTSYQSDEGDDETILSSLEWTHEELVALTRSVLIGGRVVLPIGDLFYGLKNSYS